jgi:hypothetical protein
MHSQIADFTDSELGTVARLVEQRYATPVPVEQADSELRLDPASDELSLCPTLYWSARGAHFVVFKVGEGRYRNQFFYTDADHYGTGRDEYDDLSDCVLTLLRVQADHERDSASNSAKASAADEGDDDYHGPVIL